MVGQLRGTLADRPFRLIAEGDLITLEIPHWRTAKLMRKQRSLALTDDQFARLLQRLYQQDVNIRVKVGRYLSLSMTPQPSWWVRWLGG